MLVTLQNVAKFPRKIVQKSGVDVTIRTRKKVKKSRGEVQIFTNCFKLKTSNFSLKKSLYWMSEQAYTVLTLPDISTNKNFQQGNLS